MPPKKKNSRPPAQRQKVVFVAQPKSRRPKTTQQHVSLAPSRGISRGAPVSLSTGTTVVTNASRSVTYARREFVKELATPPPPPESKSPFTGSVAVFDLNPGLHSVFPWLSSVSSFEQYRFKRLAFTFQSSMPTSAAGQVVLVTNVDAKDPLMTSPSDLMSYSGACTGRVWDSHTHRVPSQATTKKNYVRAGPIPANADQSLYDVGKFYAFCLGVEHSASLGTLWVDYEIEFFIPKITQSLSPATLVRGDNKTVSLAEPFGADEKLVNTPGSNLNWSCPASSREGWCQLNIDPQGHNYINLTASSKAGMIGESKVPISLDWERTKVDGFNFSQLVGAVIDAGGSSGIGSIANLTAEIANPLDIVRMFFRIEGEDLVNSPIVPNFVYNLWSAPPKAFF